MTTLLVATDRVEGHLNLKNNYFLNKEEAVLLAAKNIFLSSR